MKHLREIGKCFFLARMAALQEFDFCIGSVGVIRGIVERLGCSEPIPLGHENNLHSWRHPRLQRNQNIGRCSLNKDRAPGGSWRTFPLWVSSPIGLNPPWCLGLMLSANSLSVGLHFRLEPAQP